MSNVIKIFFWQIFEFIWQRLPMSFRFRFIINLILLQSKERPIKKALCHLYEIDTELQKVIDKVAIDYDEGIHPKHRLTGYHNCFLKRITFQDHVLDIGC